MTHHYATALHWAGSTGVGYDDYTRAHTVRPVDKPLLELSADPSFRGDPTRTNPEELLLAAASSCQLLSFLAVAARARADVVRYDDAAEAVMDDAQKPLWVNEIRLNPQIEIAGDVPVEKFERWVRIAHQECFIARSLRSRLVVRATLVTAGSNFVVEVAD